MITPEERARLRKQWSNPWIAASSGQDDILRLLDVLDAAEQRIEDLEDALTVQQREGEPALNVSLDEL